MILLNKSQLKVVLYAVHYRVYLIEGPLGTGKTFMVAVYMALMQMIKPKCRILIAAMQNNAVDKFYEDMVALRILRGASYSTEDSIATNSDQEGEGFLGIHTQAWY